MRPAPVLLPLLLSFAIAAHSSSPSVFQYERPVAFSDTGEACAVLDPAIFAHAAPALRDLRLFSTEPVPVEIPYILTVSEAQQTDPDIARILNPKRSGDSIDFDLAMPSRPYTDVILDLGLDNFLATAEVTGLSEAVPVPLGQFTIFDLTAQHLSRNTTLPLQESSFPRLHLRLHFQPSAPGRAVPPLSPQVVRSATIPPSRERQVLFETALTGQPQAVGHNLVTHFSLPEHLPIERILFHLAPAYTGDFLRDVRISARSVNSDAQETATGTIARVHRDTAGLDLRLQQLTVDATIGANLQGPAELVVTVDNGPGAPLPVTAVELQVRQRKLCFTAPGKPLTLVYGAPDLRAPHYSTPAGFSPAARATVARLGPETVNPQWQPSPRESKERRRQPHLIWVVLLGLSALFCVVAVRASRIVSR